MANTKAAQKYIRQSAKRTLANREIRTQLKTLSKRVQAASSDPATARTVATEYVSALDKAAKRGVIHPNKARRHKAAVAGLLKAAD